MSNLHINIYITSQDVFTYTYALSYKSCGLLSLHIA